MWKHKNAPTKKEELWPLLKETVFAESPDFDVEELKKLMYGEWSPDRDDMRRLRRGETPKRMLIMGGRNCGKTEKLLEEIRKHKYKPDFISIDEAHEVPDANGFKKFDAGKSKLTLLPFKQLEQVADILEFGAKKYGLGNWLKGTEWSRFLDAALRHVTAFSRDEDHDPETGKSHLAHAICCLLFVMYYYDKDIGDDDRIES